MENLEMYKIVATNCKEKGTSKCTSNCRDCATEALYAAGYRKQSDTIKEFVEKLKALPNRDVVHSYQLGCLVLSDADIDKLANEYNKPTAKVKGVTETNDLAYLVATAIVSDKTAQETAEYILEKGYRKQSDTIKEFADKIIGHLHNEEKLKSGAAIAALKVVSVFAHHRGGAETCIQAIDFINELKKEYGVE